MKFSYVHELYNRTVICLQEIIFYYNLFSPLCACAARVIVVVLCVVCVSTYICLITTHWNHKREIPKGSYIAINIGIVLNFANFSKNA